MSTMLVVRDMVNLDISVVAGTDHVECGQPSRCLSIMHTQKERGERLASRRTVTKVRIIECLEAAAIATTIKRHCVEELPRGGRCRDTSDNPGSEGYRRQ